jgi:hypothetical protein
MQTTAIEAARSLRNLYLVRTLVQLPWAALVLTQNAHPQLIAGLLVAYPLWDVACTLYDLKTSDQVGSARTPQVVNALLGSATAVAIALTVSTHPAYSIAAFGAWALIAGVLQLVSGLSRRKKLGGQWAMILSGIQSTAAGVAFVLGGLSGKMHAKDLGGYAVFGAIYFLIGAILLSRKLSQTVSMNDAVVSR